MHRPYQSENNQPITTSKNLINTKTSSSTTSESLTVHDRQHNDETKAEILYRNILSYCRKENTHFVDDQFPPIDRSIGQMDSLDNHRLTWLRICQITPSLHSDRRLNWSVYSSPKPSDIQQGALGDCWLMA
ncbi:unnamed protein product, partial [Adineta steineri]